MLVSTARLSVDTQKVPNTSLVWSLVENKASTRGILCLSMALGDWSTATGLQDDWLAKRQVISSYVTWTWVDKWHILCWCFHRRSRQGFTPCHTGLTHQFSFLTFGRSGTQNWACQKLDQYGTRTFKLNLRIAAVWNKWHRRS